MLWLRYMKMLVGGTLALTSISLSILYFCQNRLIYPSWAQGARKFVDTPDSRGLPYKRVVLTTKDGVNIEAYDLQNEKSTSTVLILCPNAGNIGYFIPILDIFYRQFGLSVFIYSYRGYGHSQGSPNENGMKLDAERVVSYLATDPHHKERRLILYGRSLGGANALYIASKFPQLCDGVILENTFLSIRKVIPYIFPWLSRFSFMCHEIWNSEGLMTQCSETTSFLFLNGSRDEIVPPAHMKKLYELCPARKKKFFEFPLGHHNDTIIQDGYWNIIKDFLKSNNFI
ncbi:alpha/beta hydrolase NDAI_0G01510 [Naumovozyma dairenensis CBS 421]|uniref:AB hydrolase-1 domain-containing protein n=1 Tax=Naumovozyma dairenensis (strain ATCC 10597 / BCRC 20456 / CBS 421 / NBRC 0211 / NRRL Y-12639) TaxID=1071378 RepID=G0WDR6_NAUDC|nr:hypothetical protein NDAI_0G01510 [Naumovozyma dairenensis CBS 421]CCD25927.2 hypothetical protein NDAI_0G01510 [Naumovozyma dairenensis CBS 421]